MIETPTLLIYTTYRVSPEGVQAFLLLALRMANSAKSRDGCTFLDVAQDATDPATFRLIEGWRDQADLDEFGGSEEFQALLKEAAAIGIVSRASDIYSVKDKRALAMPS